MIIRVLTIIAFTFFAIGCNADGDISQLNSANAVTDKEIELAFQTFSDAVTKKDSGLFIELADSKDIYLVRKFTSGNLGGRGPELSKLTDSKKINEKFQIPVKNQTPYSIRIQFQELPIKSFTALSHRTLSAEVETLNFDTWIPFLKESLTGAPEVKDRMPIRLSSANGKYHVYAESQIIDEILVGGFAVFSKESEKMRLVALIELL